MAQKTTLTAKQGATYIVPFAAEDDPGTDFTGWAVYFIVKAKHETANADAIINIGPVALDPVSGQASHTFTDEQTAAWAVGSYIYAAVLTDSDGNVAKTDDGEFVVEDSAYKGAIA